MYTNAPNILMLERYAANSWYLRRNYPESWEKAVRRYGTALGFGGQVVMQVIESVKRDDGKEN